MRGEERRGKMGEDKRLVERREEKKKGDEGEERKSKERRVGRRERIREGRES